MSIAAVFIRRPVATTLITIGVMLSGIIAFVLLPVAPLPQVTFPTIFVQANLPGASPEVMASTVATPLERSLGVIAGVTEMTSNSSLGAASIVLQFDPSRDVDGAARDVQAAINAARALLPTGMRTNPTYRKINPSDAPILIFSLTSNVVSKADMYDLASTVLAQKISQLQGVGQVFVGGSASPAVRIELNPNALNSYGISLTDVRSAIAATNANRPKGAIEDATHHWQLYANDQAKTAAEYMPLIIAYRNGAPVRLRDVGSAIDGMQDVRNAGFADGKPAVLVIIRAQPGANIIDTVDRIKAVLPVLRASMPDSINMQVMVDRSPGIRASFHDVERTLLISVSLVVMVVFLFLRRASATLIPSVAVPVSILGTFGVMYLCDYTLDTLSLMALTIATGFVVDDAIVVLENITRHIEAGMKPFDAALRGAREVSFTVLSMTLSLIAVFIPIMAMGGLIGRFFREFAITLSAAMLVSLAVSLSTTPMLCARWLKTHKDAPGKWSQRLEAMQNGLTSFYERTLLWALRHRRIMMLALLSTVILTLYLFVKVPKTFLPDQDTGQIIGNVQADQSTSFAAMTEKMKAFMGIVAHDPAVAHITTFFGGGRGGSNSATMFINLKPANERASTDAIINRLRGKLAVVPGATLYLQGAQDVRMGGRSSAAQYQYTLQSDSLADLREWDERIRIAMSQSPDLVDVNTDQNNKGIETWLQVDRDAASRLGVRMNAIDQALNGAFAQGQVATIYGEINQYFVIMELQPQYLTGPEGLNSIYVKSSNGNLVPLSALIKVETSNTPLTVTHQGQFASSTISFNVPPGGSLSSAQTTIDKIMKQLHVPNNVHGSMQGTAKLFNQSQQSQPILILTAIVAIYIVLGMLYESYVHPLTILSTIPTAGVGALVALMVTGEPFSLIALIGMILLIGIVKKNAIMMVDFALEVERHENLSSHDAIFKACLMRFRPIMMTTMSALLSAMPLAIGFGQGSELRRPLGISVVGGLLLSQLLTLYTTPVVYLYMDRFSNWVRRKFRLREPLKELSMDLG
ncbi:MAG TPA: multidrug efflux RND transporter permease subunit [Steroidobacteraceae bacterium]|nr:multidrug efflux RND transporter permease subunit [Steroidobacteraceae bacterium]